MKTAAFARLLAAFAILMLSHAAIAQNADQEVVSVAASPDPVVPGQTVTYTITLRNNGPSTAIGGGVNVNLDSNLALVSTSAPPGFTCSQFGSNVTCSTASLAVGTYTITLVARLAASLLAFADGNFTSVFYPSGTSPDPSPANNQKTVTTAWDSPQADLSISVADTPDPVAPDGTITYTVTAVNAGPDPASNVNFNVSNPNVLRFQSASPASGFTCALPPIGGNPTFTCSRAAVPVGSYTFTVAVQARRDVIGVNDTTLQTVFSFFAGASNDQNTADNVEVEATAYVAPKSDLSISVTDAPDPVAPDGTVTFTVTAVNAGPDPATNVNFNVYNNNLLRFRSATPAGGFSCALPAVGGAPSFTCSRDSLPVGTFVFTVELRAPLIVIGPNDTTVQTVFSFLSGTTADPVSGNNSETETTAYVAPDAELSITAVELPDPVVSGQSVEFLVEVTNNGPDSATDARLNIVGDGALQFVSIASPSGFACSNQPVGSTPSMTCSRPTLPPGSPYAFLVTLRSSTNVLPNGGLAQTIFQTSSALSDPQPTNNSETEWTTIVRDLLLKDGFE
jgi:uncharacterized repeat protein (TIGR01451 family)